MRICFSFIDNKLDQQHTESPIISFKGKLGITNTAIPLEEEIKEEGDGTDINAILESYEFNDSRTLTVKDNSYKHSINKSNLDKMSKQYIANNIEMDSFVQNTLSNQTVPSQGLYV